MGLNNMTKNQLVQFFTNVELRNLITKDKNKMKKVNSMNTPKPKNNNRKPNNKKYPPCWEAPSNPDCIDNGPFGGYQWN